MKKYLLFILLFTLISCSDSAKRTKVEFASNNYKIYNSQVEVYDGDTLIITTNNQKIKIGFCGVDCPELDQPFGKEAKQYTKKLISQGRLRINIDNYFNKDDDSGYIAYVFSYPDTNSLTSFELSEKLVYNGFAWASTQYCVRKFQSDWIHYQSLAEKEKKGLWSQPNPISPWKWRKRKKK